MYSTVIAALLFTLVVGVNADCFSICNAQCGVITAVCQNNLVVQCYNITCDSFKNSCENTCKTTLCPCVKIVQDACSKLQKNCDQTSDKSCSMQFKLCMNNAYLHCYNDYTSSLTTGFLAAASSSFS